MLKRSFSHRRSPELEATLRWMVVVSRFLGWIWMSLLVIVTVASNPPPRLWVVYGSLALATLWALLTWYMARSHPDRLDSGLGYVFDSVAMLSVGAASVASGAGELLHGGMPLSYVSVGWTFDRLRDYHIARRHADRPLAGKEAVSHPPNRLDPTGAQLLPQISDVDVHHVASRVEVVAPHP